MNAGIELEDEHHRQLLPQPVMPELPQAIPDFSDTSSLCSLSDSKDNAPPVKRPKKRTTWTYQHRNIGIGFYVPRVEGYTPVAVSVQRSKNRCCSA